MGKGGNLGASGSAYAPLPLTEHVPTSTTAAPASEDELERGLLSPAPLAPMSFLENARTAVRAAMTAVKEKLQQASPSNAHKEGYEAPQSRLKKVMGAQCMKLILAALMGAFVVLAVGHVMHGPPPPRPWGPWGMDSEVPPPSGTMGWLFGVKDFLFGGESHPDPLLGWDFLLDSDLNELDCGPPSHGPPHGPPHHGRHHGPPHHGRHHGPPHGPARPPFGPHPPFPPPPPFARELVMNTTQLVAESVEAFFGEKLPDSKTCNESLSAGVAALVKSVTDKVEAFAEEPTTSKIREGFANFTRAFPKLAGLAVIADADVSPLQLTFLRSLTSGVCYNDSGKSILKLHAIEGAVDRILLPAVFDALRPHPPPPHGPPHGPPHKKPHGPPHHEDDVTSDSVYAEDDDVSERDEVSKVPEPDSWIDPAWLSEGPAQPENKKCHPHGPPKPPPMDPEVLKGCIATNLELSRAVVRKEVFRLCHGPKPPPVRKIVRKICEFAEDNKELVRTTVLLRLQPWKIAIGSCLPPPPPHHPHGPPHHPHGPPHGDEPDGPPSKDQPPQEDNDEAYNFPDVFEGSNVRDAFEP